jgi:beta-phosphoglucomutase-like phosphatase (HAD superfamily)
MRRLGLHAGEVVSVGDAPADIKAPKSAKVTAVAAKRIKRRSQPFGFVATSTLETRLAGDFYPCAPGWSSLSVDA